VSSAKDISGINQSIICASGPLAFQKGNSCSLHLKKHWEFILGNDLQWASLGQGVNKQLLFIFMILILQRKRSFFLHYVLMWKAHRSPVQCTT